MILVDTSVLVQYLRAPSPAIRAIFSSMDCAICGVIRAEILHGARTPQDALSLCAALDTFIQLPILQETWDHLGHHLASLRAKGLSVPFQDALLAAVAFDHEAELWSYDAHFLTMQAAIPQLTLFAGPAA